MNSSSANQPEGASPLVEAMLDEASFRRVRQLAERAAGLSIPESKRAMVQSRLSRRLRATGITAFGTYLDLVERPDGQEERNHMVSALTTNVSHFFRENHHFETFTAEVIPELQARAASGAPVRLWSAGCSTGQEPYSIAMTLLSAWPEAAKSDVRILATDIDRPVLDRARAGVFDARQVSQVPDLLRQRYFRQTGSEMLTIVPLLQDMIAFRSLNLLDPWPMRQAFDAVFCRNVVIYFSEARQAQLWPRFRDSLRPGGWLFLGHSERVANPDALGLISSGVTTYRRGDTTGGGLAKTAPKEGHHGAT